jgi:hypothetical protein
MFRVRSSWALPYVPSVDKPFGRANAYIIAADYGQAFPVVEAADPQDRSFAAHVHRPLSAEFPRILPRQCSTYPGRLGRILQSFF